MDMFGAVEELIEFESVAQRGAPDVDILCASLDSVYWEILTYTFDFLCCNRILSLRSIDIVGIGSELS